MLKTVNVVDHGADPTGVNNSDDAIRSAIIELDNNSTLIFPPGIYIVSKRVKIVNIENFTVQADGAVLSLVDPEPTSNGGSAIFMIQNCRFFKVSDLTIVDQAITQGYNGLWVMNSDDGLIDNVTVDGVLWAGITVFDTVAGTSKNITIRNCNSYNARFGISSNGDSVKIQGCHVEMPGFPIQDGYYDGIMVLTGSNDNIVQGNTILNCGAAGVYITATTNIVVSGNTVTGCLGRGIEMDGDVGITTGGTIIGNAVQDNYGNINLVKAKGITVTGNTCSNNNPAQNTAVIAVNIGSNDVVVIGNAIKQVHPTAMAVYVQEQCTGIDIIYNRIDAANKYQAPPGTHIVDRASFLGQSL